MTSLTDDMISEVKISKSRFMAGVQCLTRLYFLVHEPEIATQEKGTNAEIVKQGREVGLLARQLFPGGVEVSGVGPLEQAIGATKELLSNPKVPAIFEGVVSGKSICMDLQGMADRAVYCR